MQLVTHVYTCVISRMPVQKNMANYSNQESIIPCTY
jgi:hypothetical protein